MNPDFSSPNIIKIFFNLLLYTHLSQLYEDSVDTNGSLSYPVFRIVKGREAELSDVPYQVAFKTIYSYFSKQYITFCGGSIVTNLKLLSAAHCFNIKKKALCDDFIYVEGKALGNKYAVAGCLVNKDVYNPKDTEKGQWRSMKKVMYPAKYTFPKYDIAIVILRRPFVLNDNISPIPLASRYQDYSGECIASGFGQTTPIYSKLKVLAAHLMLASIELMKTKTCNQLHKSYMRHFICTSDLVADISLGDSGGPLVCHNTGDPNDKGKGVLVGITCGARPHNGSIFTRVSSYKKYISTNCADFTLLPNYIYVFPTLAIYNFYQLSVFPS
ncbi:hypothetical protein ACJJTC_019721 [Scirpophaga incertulas]